MTLLSNTIYFHFILHKKKDRKKILRRGKGFTAATPLASSSSDSILQLLCRLRTSIPNIALERRYLLKEFLDLVSCGEASKLLEVGCGNGSNALPILRGDENIIVYACDCSSEILEKAKEFVDATDTALVRDRFHPFYCDFCTTGFPEWLACNSCRENFPQKQHDCFSDIEEKNRTNLTYLLRESGCCIGGVDFITLIFTLSAVRLQRMPTAITECYSVLKSGGLLLFRDYGLSDMTVLQFKPEQRVGYREYMRADGTPFLFLHYR